MDSRQRSNPLIIEKYGNTIYGRNRSLIHQILVVSYIYHPVQGCYDEAAKVDSVLRPTKEGREINRLGEIKTDSNKIPMNPCYPSVYWGF